MGYNINFSYDKRFVDLMSSLRGKYGEDLFTLDGIGKQLDLNYFRDSFFSSEIAADVAVDPNSNVMETSAITYTTESNKAQLRLDSYYLLWKQMLEDGVSESYAADVIESQLNGAIYINDFHGISSGKPYCFNYSLLDVVYSGLPMVEKIVSHPAQHLLAFKSQVEQFVVLAANSTLGATGMADSLIAMSYYMAKILKNKGDAHVRFSSEEDCFEYFKQNIISIIYTVNQPLRADQSPFTNVSVYDEEFLKSICDGIVFPDGSTPDISLILHLQEIYLDAMNEELSRTPITFPITTACISVKDGEPLDEDFLRMVAEKNKKYGFINFYFGDTATLSSCCRLRSSTKNEFFNSFGAGSTKIGSLGVVTINFPRVAMQTSSIEEFEERLLHLVDLTGVINEAKRNIVKKRIDSGHMPFYSLEFMQLEKQYSTTGVNGFFECLDILGKNLLTEEGQNYAKLLLVKLNTKIDAMQSYYKAPHNLEQVPGENSSIKMCKKDKLLGFDAGVKLYSNQFIPLTLPTDILNRIKIQGLLDQYFSGGSVLHLNIEEEITDTDVEVNLLKYCIKKGVVYISFCYLLNKCEKGHMFVGKHSKCPVCKGNIKGKYMRVVGFLTQVEYWAEERREEDFPFRVFY